MISDYVSLRNGSIPIRLKPKEKQNMKFTHTLAALAALALSGIGAQAAQIFSEDFNALIPATSLSGQGDWGGPTGPKVMADPGTGAAYYGFSGNFAEYSGADAEESHPFSGLNDTEAVTMEMDLRINEDKSYTYWTIGQSGFSLGVEYGNLTLRGAAGGTQNHDHNLAGDKTYHLFMTILPTTFGGAGSATVTLAEWIDASTLGPKTTIFSNIKLKLDNPGKALSDNWNTVLRLHGTGAAARADNLSLTQGESALVEMTALSPQVFQNNGSSKIIPVAFTNIGTDVGNPLNVTGVTLSGADADSFTIPTVWTAAVAANGGTGTIDLPFVPAGSPAGTYFVTLEVTSDAESSPVTIEVAVEVNDPIAVVSPTVLNFGDFTNNPGPKTLTVNIANDGGGHTLNIYRMDVFGGSSAGAFTVGSFPASLAPGTNVDVTITFDPGADEGLFSGELEIDTDGSPQEMFTVPLSATVTNLAPIPVFTEDFDSLTTGSSLSGQGAWGGATGPKVVADPGSFGFTGNIVEYTGTDNNVNHPISGLNDVGLLTMEFDLRINGDLSYTYWIIGQSGISVGVERGNMTLRGAAGSTKNFDHNLTGDHVYHMILTVDPTAFNGDGAATVTYAKYTAENTQESAQTAFSGVQLTLNTKGKLLSDNTNFSIRLHNAGTTARADNLSIVQVPKPTFPVEIESNRVTILTNDGRPETLLVDFRNIGIDDGQTLDITGITLSGFDANFFTTPTIWDSGVAAHGGTGTIRLPFDSANAGDRTYWVALEVTSNAANSPHTISVEVDVTSPLGYANWALGFPALTATNPALDFDNDGLTTGIEWVVGGNPTANDAAVAPTYDAISDPNKLLYTYRRSVAANSDSDTAIVVEYGSDLAGWRNTKDHGAADGVIVTEAYDIQPGIDAVTVALPKTLGASAGKLFVRLKVTITP